MSIFLYSKNKSLAVRLPSQKGDGLGPALVKKALDLTSAKTSITSKPGESATFTARLKMAERG
jgi:signal transduction histidine kinase